MAFCPRAWIRAKFDLSASQCSGILSAENCSEEMSAYEGRDIEPTRASRTPDTQQRVGMPTAQSSGRGDSGVGEHQVRRVLAAYRREGAPPPVHGNRGRKPWNAVPKEIAAAAVIPASEKHAGFNHSHLTEVLAEREGIQLGLQTVTRLLNYHELTSASAHRPRKHTVRGEFMPQEGMLPQIDGSHHPGSRTEGHGLSCGWRWTTPPARWSMLSAGPRGTPGATSC